MAADESCSSGTPSANDVVGVCTGRPEIVLHEANFLPLHNQSNIYGLLSFHINGSNKLVVATLRGEVYSLEIHDPLTQRPPSLKLINLSYIPGNLDDFHFLLLKFILCNSWNRSGICGCCSEGTQWCHHGNHTH